MTQFWIRDLPEIKLIDHDLIYLDLLVNTTDHHFFIDGLIITSNEVTVKINIHVVHMLYAWQWLVHINVIHIKSMFWQFKPTFPQKLCTVNDRMHQNVLSLVESSCLIPCKNLILRQGRIAHDFFVPYTLFFINIICNEHIQHGISASKFTQFF